MSSDPDITIDLAEPCPAWRVRIPDIDALCRRTATAALADADGPAELSIVLGDDALVRGLNRDWRGKDRPTNVLSFPADADGTAPPPGAPRLLGDVVLAFETVAAEAAAAGKPLAAHLSHLLVHGILHLLGHDHAREPEATAMERLETAILGRLGLADPYAEARHG